jgi:hypothetical protein
MKDNRKIYNKNCDNTFTDLKLREYVVQKNAINETNKQTKLINTNTYE